MKKSLLALAVAGAFSGAAFAQSSVTLFGVLDTGISYYKGDGNGNVWAVSTGGINTSRIGVRGTEDLGGGLRANFHFEAGVNTDNGTGTATNTNNQVSGGVSSACTVTGATPAPPATTVSCASTTTPGGSQGLTFNRKSWVGLSGGFGETRIGRDYMPLFQQIIDNDPFGANGVGNTSIYKLIGFSGTAAAAAAFVQTTQRASNAVEYLTPQGIGGLYFHALYAFGENPSDINGVSQSNHRDGNTLGARLGYAGGPVNISAAATQTHYFQNAADTQGIYTAYYLSGTLTFGNFKPMFQIGKQKIDVATGSDPERVDWMLGLVMTFGPTDLRISYTHYDIKGTSNDAQLFAIGPVYNLSRRTALYASYALMDNKGSGTGFALDTGRATTVAGGKSLGFDVGIRHFF
jgi:predicted porin